jgi:hypothetical protein
MNALTVAGPAVFELNEAEASPAAFVVALAVTKIPRVLVKFTAWPATPTPPLR